MKSKIFFAVLVLSLAACGLLPINNDTEVGSAPSVAPAMANTSLPASPTIIPTQDTSFRLETLNTIPPEDIIAEVSFFGNPGGNPLPCPFNQTKPGITAEQVSIDVMGGIFLMVCYPATEEIRIQVTRPDGKVEESVEPTNFNSGEGVSNFLYVYKTDLAKPRGAYTFSFSGKGWELSQIIEVHEAETASLYLVREQNQLIFYKFKPQEKVRLFLYEETSDGIHQMQGWKEFTMDASGGLVINTLFNDPTKTYSYAAVGEFSGQAIGREQGFRKPSNDVYSMAVRTDVYCGKEAPPIGIRSGDYVEVLEKTQLVGSFDSSNTLINVLKKGTLLRIDEGPVCHDGSFWWTVSCLNQECFLGGQVRESTGDRSLLKILAGPPPTPTPAPIQIPACRGAKPTRLEPGMKARVSKVATQLSMRASAGMDAPKVHVIAAGRRINILNEAPVCANQAYWWHVTVPELGFDGWVREGDNEEYWIDPLP